MEAKGNPDTAPHTAGCSQTSSSILNESLRSTPTEQDRAAIWPTVSTATIRGYRQHPARDWEEKLQLFPVNAPPGQSTALRSHRVPVHARRCHPRKQQTSTWERSTQLLSLLLPFHPGWSPSHHTDETHREEEPLKWGFPKRAPESSGWLFRERWEIMNPQEQGCIQRWSRGDRA